MPFRRARGMVPLMSLKISRILHAGYIFECEGIQIAFDPIFENPFSRNCHAYPDVRFDLEQIRDLHFAAVFISHYHDDHCSLESLNLLDRRTPIYIYCLHEELLSMIRELGFLQVHSLHLNRAVPIGPFEVIPRRALDAEVDSLFQIKAQGLNVLNVVDSWLDPETLFLLSQERPWDLVLWPFQTMREVEVLSPRRAPPAVLQLPEEWREQLKTLEPRYVVPSSCQFRQEPWSWYNSALFPITYQQFQKEVEDLLPRARVVRMNPSVSMVFQAASLETSAPLSWVFPVGEQEVDYEYRSDVIPPSTAEIARNLPPLSASQRARVMEYCRSDLLRRYRDLPPSEEAYFTKPRLWRLSLYDHDGEETHFWYELRPGSIEPASENKNGLAWTTELPTVKLHAALEAGESLTSMYVRINNECFAKDIEKEVSMADLLEDPLLRCLFSGSFGAYQAAQLRRLRERGCEQATCSPSSASVN